MMIILDDGYRTTHERYVEAYGLALGHPETGGRAIWLNAIRLKRMDR